MPDRISETASQIVARVAAGDARAVARAATAIENRTAESAALLRQLATHAGHAIVAGITGPPGAGKSTLVDALARAIRHAGKTVGILAVDPTSRVSGGAILGDRIRMQAHHGDPGVFIRSMATRGAVGGLARATADLALLLDAAGKDYVLVETVGVGQDEVEVAGVADVTVLVLVPGMGDDVQVIKAGIMEIADIFVINKADHPGADRIESEIASALGMAHRADGWQPPVLRTVATEDKGIAQLLAAIAKFPRGTSGASGAHPQARRAEFAIDHLGIAVQSIEAALGFYQGQLGMQLASRETVPHEKVNVAMLPVGGPRIELLEPTDPDSVVARFLAKRGEGLHHVALRVPDLAVTVARLHAAGARLLNNPQIGAGGHRYVFVHPASTGGVLLELIEDK
ncbi:MAG TPA: methylmalonyl Co-A mutase-associated GTPase MeaB [Bryobacteraceae bacterium]|nr:methylmalonyl Co-A mutase-associated GTPase MeaB [Bryobacteraceae bacterium]